MVDKLRIGENLLNAVNEKLQQTKQIKGALDDLFISLKELHDFLPSEDWHNFCSKQCIEHPIRTTLHSDPFTERAFSKPRGYAGDAVIIDYIYRDAAIQDQIKGLSAQGKAIYEYVSTAPAALAVKERKDIIAKKIDQIAEEIESPRILCLACGHLREAKLSEALKQGKIGTYVALDFDKESLSVVEQDLGKYGVQCVQGYIKDIITGKINPGEFDFIYAAGLFDYLSDSVAKDLVRKMFQLLRPKGSILICNFLRNIRDVGYMESFMDWELNYRDIDEMEELVANIPIKEVAEKNAFIDNNQCVVFLEIKSN